MRTFLVGLVALCWLLLAIWVLAWLNSWHHVIFVIGGH